MEVEGDAVQLLNQLTFREMISPTSIVGQYSHRKWGDLNFEINLLHSSLYVIPPHCEFRRKISRLLESRVYTILVPLLIVLNVVIVILQSIITPFLKPSEQDLADAVFDGFEKAFTVAFLIELLIRIASRGFIAHKWSFMRAGWNILDAVIVLGSLYSLASPGPSINVMRLMRILRPLRTMSKLNTLRRCISTVYGSIYLLWSVLALFMMQIVMFSAVSIDIFAGLQYNRCTYSHNGRVVDEDTSLCGWRECPSPSKGSCFNYTNLVFQNSSIDMVNCGASQQCSTIRSVPWGLNFDNFYNSFLTNFVLLSNDNMQQLLWDIVNYAGPAYVLFGVFFFVVCCCTTMQLIIAVMANRWNASEDMNGGPKTPEHTGKWGTHFINPKHTPAARLAYCLENTVRFQEAFLRLENINRLGTFNASSSNRGKSIREQLRVGSEESLIPDDTRENETRTFHLFVQRLAKSPGFRNLMMAVIILNLTLLSSDHYPATEEWVKMMKYQNVACTAISIVECLVNIIAFGFLQYVRTRRIDGLLVLAGIIDLIIGDRVNLVVFRALRTMRIVKMIRRHVHSITYIVFSLKDVAIKALSMYFLLFLLVLIYSMMGMVIFGGNVRDDSYRLNYNTIGSALITSFVVVTNEGWSGVMVWTSQQSIPLAIIFFCSLFIIGNWILFNLLVVILVTSFSKVKSEVEEVKCPRCSKMLRKLEVQGSTCMLCGKEQVYIYCCRTDEVQLCRGCLQFKKKFSPPVSFSLVGSALKKLVGKTRRKRGGIQRGSQRPPSIILEPPLNERWSSAELVPKGSGINTPTTATPTPSIALKGFEMELIAAIPKDSDDFKRRGRGKKKRQRTFRARFNEMAAHYNLHGKSLNLFPPNSPIRVACAVLSMSKLSQLMWVIVIFGSCVVLVMDEPRLQERNQSLFRKLELTNIVVASLFVVETSLKIIALGAWDLGPSVAYDADNNRIGRALTGVSSRKKGYFRSIQNVMDFLITVLTFISIFVPSGIVKALRTLRCIRLINRNEELSRIVKTILSILSEITGTIAAVFSILFFFALFGLHVYKGKMHECTDSSVLDRKGCMGTYGMGSPGWPFPLLLPRTFEPATFNFDNIGEGIKVALIFAVGDSWIPLMFNLMDVVGLDSSMTENASWYLAFLPILYVIIGQYFSMNILTAVLADFADESVERKDQDELQLLSRQQKAWQSFERIHRSLTVQLPFVAPEPWFRLTCFKLVRSKWFEFIMNFAVIANVGVICSKHYNMSVSQVNVVDTANLVFVSLFTLEAALKLIGLGAARYFTEKWNRVDAVLVSLCWAGIIVGIETSVLRGLRIIRILRLVSSLESLNQLVSVLRLSIPSIVNIVMIILLLLYVYSIIGMNIFGTVKKTGILQATPYNSYSDFTSSVLVLNQVMTGSGWQYFSAASGIQHPYCTPSVDCGIPVLSWLYHFSYILLVGWILLNLIISILINEFNVLQEMKDNTDKLRIVDAAALLWQRYDPQGTQLLPSTVVIRLMNHLPWPLRMPHNDKIGHMQQLGIRTDGNGLVSYNAFMKAVGSYIFGIPLHRSRDFKFVHIFYAEMRIAKAWRTWRPRYNQVKTKNIKNAEAALLTASQSKDEEIRSLHRRIQILEEELLKRGGIVPEWRSVTDADRFLSSDPFPVAESVVDGLLAVEEDSLKRVRSGLFQALLAHEREAHNKTEVRFLLESLAEADTPQTKINFPGSTSAQSHNSNENAAPSPTKLRCSRLNGQTDERILTKISHPDLNDMLGDADWRTGE